MSAVKRILIKGGSVFDPAQGLRGERRDIYLSDGVVSEEFQDPEIVIEADGRPVLAGGVDPHCHLAHPGQVFARIFGTLASYEDIGKAYASAGYTHVHHPFVTLVTAACERRSLSLIPWVDKSYGVALDLRDMGKAVRGNDHPQFEAEARALLCMTGALRLFLPLPWLKHKQRHYVQKNISSKKVLQFLSTVEDEALCRVTLGWVPDLLNEEIPSPWRFHLAPLASGLGFDGGMERVVGFLEAGGSADIVAPCEEDPLEIACAEGAGPGVVSVDIGIGSPMRFAVSRATEPKLSHGRGSGEATARWEEAPSGHLEGWRLLGMAPSSWRLALCSWTPGRAAMGGLAKACAWLMSRQARPAQVDEAMGGRVLDFYDIAALTRLEPALRLGLRDLGHLKVGARANVAIYDVREGMPAEDLVRAFSMCWCLIKDGALVRAEGEFTGESPSVTIRFGGLEADLDGLARRDLFQNPTLRLEHLRRDGP